MIVGQIGLAQVMWITYVLSSISPRSTFWTGQIKPKTNSKLRCFIACSPPAKQKKRIDDVVSWDSNPRSPHSTNTYELSFGMLTTTLPDDCLQVLYIRPSTHIGASYPQTETGRVMRYVHQYLRVSYLIYIIKTVFWPYVRVDPQGSNQILATGTHGLLFSCPSPTSTLLLTCTYRQQTISLKFRRSRKCVCV